MRPSESSNSTMAASTSSAAEIRNLHSPIPYLFGGLSLMLALIAVSLLFLACSYRKRYSNSSDSASSPNGGDEEKQHNKMVDQVEMSNSEPKIVVIMAGESNPTYLAKPVSSSSSSTSHTQQQQEEV